MIDSTEFMVKQYGTAITMEEMEALRTKAPKLPTLASHIMIDWFTVRCGAPGSQHIVWDPTRAKCADCVRLHRASLTRWARLRFDFRRHIANPINARVAAWRESREARRG